MSELSPAALRWIADHHGVITTRALRAAGVGPSTTARLVAAGVLVPVHKGVFIIASAPRTFEQRCVVLCSAYRTGFVTGPSAGALAGLRRMPRLAALHFAVPHGHHLSPVPGVHFRQTTACTSRDRAANDDGIVTASWARLAFDLAADLAPLDHLSVLQQLLHQRRVSVEELVAIDGRLSHPARDGSVLFRQNLQRLDGSAPNESHPELVVADALRRRKVPVEHQTRVLRLPNGSSARIDLAVPEIRWGIEIDIHPEHRTYDGSAADVRRARQLHVIGWQLEHVTEPDLDDVERLADELARLYHARRRMIAQLEPRVS